MLCFSKLLFPSLQIFKTSLKPLNTLRFSSTMACAEPELDEFVEYMERLKNYERLGVPAGAGTESGDGFDLGRMRRLLLRLGDPHTNYKCVHIAGTKGKGSCAAFISNILREEGYKVGTYTSPHLLTIRERISFNGEPVSAKILNNLFIQSKEALNQSIESENGALSHFEVFTALAFLLFSEQKVDFAVIEAGLGGARDATNVIRNSELILSIITSIGEEHLAALGGSLQNIARAKSGIIKSGRPVVIGGPFEKEIEEIISEKANLMNSEIIKSYGNNINSCIKYYSRENEVPYQACDISINLQDSKSGLELKDLKLKMLGNHQLQNAVISTCAALSLQNQGFEISNKSIRSGLQNTRLAGRSQFLTKTETSKLGLNNISFLLDGAHTEASAKGLAEVVEMVRGGPGPCGPMAFVVAMATDKDHFSFAKQLLSGTRPDIVILTEVNISGGKSRSISALNLKSTWIKSAEELGVDFVDLGTVTTGENNEFEKNKEQLVFAVCENTAIKDVIKIANELIERRESEKSGLVCVTGSLHLVSSVLSVLTC
ncbi:hypothetical protein LUZ60_010078 [Juncus effusus]|nr:hypothetical protein LUZ60_010078 [Juncus effusus]